MLHSYQPTEVCISWFWFNNSIREPKGELKKFKFLKSQDFVSPLQQKVLHHLHNGTQTGMYID